MASIGASAGLVRNARARAALSQRRLASLAGTAQSVVARIELGATSPTVDTLERLVGAAGFALRLAIDLAAILDRQLLDDVPRILALTPEDRLREVANLQRFVQAARRV